MPKLNNITNADLIQIRDALYDALGAVHDAEQRIEKGYCDTIENPVELAKAFISASSAYSGLAGKILIRLALDEQRRELEALLTERQ